MARQPLAFLLLGLAGCADRQTQEPMFEMPVAAAALQPEQGGPFEEPIGFVANGHGGRIAILALKQGRYLTDDATASFLRSNPLATGGARLLSSVAAYAPDAATVTVFAGDRAFGQLLKVPYVIDLDERGSPVEQGVVISEEPRFDDADGSGDSPTLTGLVVKNGYTSTESWTVVRETEGWRVFGSRSGKQENLAFPGQEFIGDHRNVTFVIEGDGTEGDSFVFSTDNGLVEIDVGGMPLQAAMAPDMGRMALVVQDAATDQPVLRWFDPALEQVAGEVALPEDARPHRLAWTPDGERLYVSDRGRSAVWEITDDTVTEIPLPWPTLDVAPMLREEGDQLFLVPTSARSVWVMDLQTQALKDLNTAIPGVQGMSFSGPVRGIAAMHVPFRMPETDADGVHRFERAVAVSLSTGRIVFMEEQTGCLVKSFLGPRTRLQSDFGFGGADYTTNFSAVGGGPFLEENAGNGRHVVVNPCGGIAKGEIWTLRFDEAIQGWRVSGSRSGELERYVIEDERYVSDNGEFSVVIRAGQSPSEEGWTLRFEILEGIVSADGNNNDETLQDVSLDLPGDPVYFSYRVGPADSGWRLVDERPFVLAFAEASDAAGRVEPNTGQVEAVWQ